MNSNIRFEVNAGKYESDGERNYKYCYDYSTMEEAVAAYNANKLWQYPFSEIVGKYPEDDLEEVFTHEDILQWQAQKERVDAIAALQRIELQLTGSKFCECRSIEAQEKDIIARITRLQQQVKFFKKEAEESSKASNHWYTKYSALHNTIAIALKK